MKARLTVEAARVFHGIVADVRRWPHVLNYRPALASTASDHMDGHYRPSDKGVVDLIRAGVIFQITDRDESAWPKVHRTWHLTEFGCDLVAGNAAKE